jgi:hypothetical protein
MKTKQKNNKLLPATSACCRAIIRNECKNHFSIYIYIYIYISGLGAWIERVKLDIYLGYRYIWYL